MSTEKERRSNSTIHNDLLAQMESNIGIRSIKGYRFLKQQTKKKRVREIAACVSLNSGRQEDPLDVFALLSDLTEYFEKLLSIQQKDACDVLAKEGEAFDHGVGYKLQSTFEKDLACSNSVQVGFISGQHNHNRAIYLVLFGMSKRSYEKYVQTQSGKWPKFYEIWKVIEKLDVGGIADHVDVSGTFTGKQVDVKDTIQRMLGNEVLGPLLECGMGEKKVLDITISGDGANFSDQKGVVTLSMGFNAFGSRKHSPALNIPLAHVLCNESASELRTCLRDVYQQLYDLDDEVLEYDGKETTIRIFHCNDVKYNVVILGMSSWSCNNGFSLWCKCNKKEKDVIEINDSSSCEIMTDLEFKR